MTPLTADFIRGTRKPEDFPKTLLPEIAFAGRSNVGKSSLLNSILYRKNLARISSTPGKTQEINFYLVDSKWMFADLPGFGYASVSKTTRESWVQLNFAYLGKRPSLKLICCLVDSRHDPMERDLALIEWLENNGKKYVVILTKCDKISDKLLGERLDQFRAVLAACNNIADILPYSTVDGRGRKELLAIIKRYCND